jgi:Ca2+-transporting ATPase
MLMRCIPDRFLLACLPRFVRRIWEPRPERYTPVADPEKTLTDGGDGADDDGFRPKPLRVMTSLRGERARKHQHRDVRQYLHDKKVNRREKKRGAASLTDKNEARTGSTTVETVPAK